MKVSFIIPSYDDGKNVLNLVKQLHLTKEQEIIVVESGDSKYSKKLQRNVRFFKSGRGRAVQMNFAATKARGRVLCFLHADSTINKIDFSFLDNIKKEGWGFFRVAFNSPKKYFRFIEFTSNWRACYLKIPFGDQGLFIHRFLFKKIRGFPVKNYEDINIAQILRKHSKPICSNQVISTSPRRFEDHGIIKSHFIIGLIFISYFISKNFSKWLYKFIS